MARSTSDGLGGRVVGFTLAGLLLLAAAAYLGVWYWAGDEAPRNAAVEGVGIGGLTAGEAEARLRDRLAEREREPVRVSFGDGREHSVQPDDAGLSVDYAESVARAGAGSSLRPSRLWEAVTGGGGHRAVVEVDEDAMQATLDRLDRSLDARPVEGDVVFRDGKAVPVRPRPGRVLERGAAAKILQERFLHGGSQKLPTRAEDPVITADAVREAMDEFARPAMSAPVTLVLGGRRVVAPPRLFGAGLDMVADGDRLVPGVDGEKMLAALRPVMRTVARMPEDARIVIRKGKPVVIPAKVGVEMDPAELERGFADAAVQRGRDRRLAVAGKLVRPSLTTKQARALGIKEKVSSFTTYFPYAEYRNVNLTRAARLIDGTLLEPGETFSMNRIVGERTKDNGFTEGYIVSDGIFKKDLGGGVSQIATTTFNAMFFAGLADVEHKPHSVYISRYPEGREATLAWPTLDLKFRNDTRHGVLVKASVRRSTPSSQGAATVTMYSTKTWDITARKGPRTNPRQPEVRYLQDPECEPATGVPGFSVDVFRDFRRPGKKKIVRTEKFHTDYIANDTVRCGPDPRG